MEPYLASGTVAKNSALYSEAGNQDMVRRDPGCFAVTPHLLQHLYCLSWITIIVESKISSFTIECSVLNWTFVCSFFNEERTSFWHHFAPRPLTPEANPTCSSSTLCVFVRSHYKNSYSCQPTSLECFFLFLAMFSWSICAPKSACYICEWRPEFTSGDHVFYFCLKSGEW